MPPVPHILHLTLEEQKRFLDSFDVVFSDCDGVLWEVLGSIPLSGVGVKALQDTGKRVVFVSNNSTRSDEEYQAKLIAIGANPVEKENIVHPAKAIVSYLKHHKPGERVFSICSATVNRLMQSNGIEVETLKLGRDVLPTELPEILAVKQKVGAVVYDININYTYIEIAKACEYLKQKDCIFVTGGNGAFFPITKTLRIPGMESLVKDIGDFTNKEQIALSKPSRRLGDYLKQVYKITQPERCLFIGDSLVQDVAFAKACGFQTVFVAATGLRTEADMLAAPEEQQPDYFCDGIVDFAQLVANVNR